MYNIVEQPPVNSSSSSRSGPAMLSTTSNDTSKPVITTTSAGYKIDCAKECPCGVPVIPVPDQWLEVMVTGGFKVWHIIFIIIAFVVTIVVVYCCFHRCRIPRTKQEIEADLMRSNLTTKFREYLQEFPNEPTTFLDALKRVQDLEEKSEQDDMGARKRKGWLKRMGKEREKGAAGEASGPEEPAAAAAAMAAAEGTATTEANDPVVPTRGDGEGEKRLEEGAKLADEQSTPVVADDGAPAAAAAAAAQTKQVKSASSSKKALKSKASKTPADNKLRRENSQEAAAAATVAVVDKSVRTKSEINEVARVPSQDQDKSPAAGGQAMVAASRPARARRKRDKPNLSRTKATHGGSRAESLDQNHNVLAVPVASHHHHHHQHNHHSTHHIPKAEEEAAKSTAIGGKRSARSRSKQEAKAESTVIQMNEPSPSPPPPPVQSSKSKKDKK